MRMPMGSSVAMQNRHLSRAPNESGPLTCAFALSIVVP